MLVSTAWLPVAMGGKTAPEPFGKAEITVLEPIRAVSPCQSRLSKKLYSLIDARYRFGKTNEVILGQV